MKTKHYLAVNVFFVFFMSFTFHAECSTQVLLMHMDDDLLSDSAPGAHTVVLHGDVTRAVGQGKFGDAAYFDGAGDYLSVNLDESLILSTDDFTIDFWFMPVKYDNSYEIYLSYGTSSNVESLVLIRYRSTSGGNLALLSRIDGNTSDIFSSVVVNDLNNWHHIAVTRKDKIFYLFFDGVLQDSPLTSDNDILATSLYIGSNHISSSPSYFQGYIDELRIVKGQAYWTTENNFVLPSAPYTDQDCIYVFEMDRFKGSTQTSPSVPLFLTNISNDVGIEGIDLTIEFDPNIIEAKSLTLTGGILEGQYLYNVGLNSPGKIIASIAAKAEPFVLSSGVIGFINFDILAENDSTLTISEIVVNESKTCPKSEIIEFDYDSSPSLPADSPIDSKNYSTNINTPLSITFTVNDPDTSTGDLLLSASSSDMTIIPSNNILFSSDTNLITMTITPAEDQYGDPVAISISINDGSSVISSQIQVTVNGYFYLAGEIQYYTGTNNPIKNVTLVLSGADLYSVVSDENGKYTFNNIEPGNYTLAAMKSDEFGGLGADDATRIRRYKVQDGVSFNCYQMLAADVSLNGTISSLDASRIGIGSAKIDANTEACMQDGSCIHWIFVKPITAGCVDWPPISNSNEIQIIINSNITDNNLTGIRLGDVTGNWESTESGNSFTNSLGMTFNLIPAGTFDMGSPDDEPGRETNETQHTVTISEPFYMQTTEVTQGQWNAVMGNNPSMHSSCGEDCPVEKVSWDNAQAFILKLNELEGDNRYSLPTEAQWEYAARAGSTTALPNGSMNATVFPSGCSSDSKLNEMGWYCGNANSTTHQVAQKQKNAWGLYDVHGNVWEWCLDWYGSYPSSPVTDPTGPSTGSQKILRGCSWGDWPQWCRAAYRLPQGFGNHYTGLRVLRKVN